MELWNFGFLDFWIFGLWGFLDLWLRGSVDIRALRSACPRVVGGGEHMYTYIHTYMAEAPTTPTSLERSHGG